MRRSRIYNVVLPERGPHIYENWLAGLRGTEAKGAIEYPLFSDAWILGGVANDYGPYRLTNTIAAAANPPQYHRPAIVLRMAFHLEYSPPQMKKTNYEHYHGGDLSDEIAALVSLCLGIRLKAGGETRRFEAGDGTEGRPVAYGHKQDPLLTKVPDSPVLSSVLGEHNIDAIEVLSSYPSLKPEDAIALLLAARLYQEAVWIAETTPELSWIMLTSAVETVANRWRNEKVSPLEKLRASQFGPELEKLLREKGDDEFVEQVAGQIAQYMGATKTFIDFLLEFLPEPPSKRPPEWAQHPWNRRSMKKTFSVIYGYRSKALHTDIPFPAPMCMAPWWKDNDGVSAEKPIGFAMSVGTATWIAADVPIFLQTFEYIVRNALLKWWTATAQQGSSNTHTDA